MKVKIPCVSGSSGKQWQSSVAEPAGAAGTYEEVAGTDPAEQQDGQNTWNGEPASGKAAAAEEKSCRDADRWEEQEGATEEGREEKSQLLCDVKGRVNRQTYLGLRWRRIGAVGLMGRGLRRLRPVGLLWAVWSNRLLEMVERRRLVMVIRRRRRRRRGLLLRRLVLRMTLGGLVLRVHWLGRVGGGEEEIPRGCSQSAFLSSACHGLGNWGRAMVTQGRGGPQGGLMPKPSCRSEVVVEGA